MKVTFNVVDSYEESDRADGGFGSNEHL